MQDNEALTEAGSQYPNAYLLGLNTGGCLAGIINSGLKEGKSRLRSLVVKSERLMKYQ